MVQLPSHLPSMTDGHWSLILSVSLCQSRLHSLEAEVGQDRHLGLQLELLKKDKARVLSQLMAQESVIDGLKVERKIWGQELAQQGGKNSGEYLFCTLSLPCSAQKKLIMQF